LKAIALVRAKTMHATIVRRRPGASGWCGTAKASTTADAAKGIAKSVCENATNEP
jgi:hypothetical protein